MLIPDTVAAYLAAYPETLEGDFIRYAVGATGVWLITSVWLKTRLARRKIRPDSPPWRQIRTEILASLRTVAIFAAFGTLIRFGAEAGLMTIYWDWGAYGYWWLPASFAVIVVAHDAWFYWTHWLMHRPRLYRLFHRLHHRSNNPTPFASYSFDWSEAVVNAVFFPLILLIIPAHPIVLLAFTWHMMIRNALGHSGYEVFPARRDGRPRFGWMTTVTHHDIHHADARWNLGLYFTWWDRWMGTEHPEYLARFAASAGKSAPTGKRTGASAAAGAIIGAAALFLLAAPPAAADGRDISGLWATEGISGVIEIAPCPGAPALRCGEVRWTWDETAWRHGPVGALMLRDLRADGPGWTGGALLHPETGFTFEGRATRRSPDILTLEGCALILCETATWRSLASLAALRALGAMAASGGD